MGSWAVSGRCWSRPRRGRRPRERRRRSAAWMTGTSAWRCGHQWAKNMIALGRPSGSIATGLPAKSVPDTAGAARPAAARCRPVGRSARGRPLSTAPGRSRAADEVRTRARGPRGARGQGRAAARGRAVRAGQDDGQDAGDHDGGAIRPGSSQRDIGDRGSAVRRASRAAWRRARRSPGSNSSVTPSVGLVRVADEEQCQDQEESGAPTSAGEHPQRGTTPVHAPTRRTRRCRATGSTRGPHGTPR